MAPKYSPDTEAIIDRLKAEGDLIRNSDTNSLRSVSLNFEKFGNIFESINKEILSQTDFMQASVKMAEEQKESIKRQNDFDDLKRNESQQKEAKSEKSAEKRNKSLIKGIAGAMSLKNMRNAALIGGGVLAGGLIAKGFIQEAFPNFSSDVGETFNELKTTMSEFNRTIADLSEKMSNFADNVPWGSLAIALAGLALLPSRAARFGFGLAAGAATGGYRLLRGGKQTGGGLAQAKAIKEAQEAAARETAEVAARRAAQIAAVEALEGTTDPALRKVAEQQARVAQQQLTESLAKRQAAVTALILEQDRLAMEAMGVTPKTVLPSGERAVAGLFNSPQAPNINVADLGNGRFSYQNMADGGKFMSPDAAVSRLSAAGLGPDGLPSVKTAPTPTGGGRGNGRLQMRTLANDRQAAQALKTAGVKIAGKYVATEAGKIAVKFIPLLGAAVGIGFAAYSFIIGDYTTAGLETGSFFLPSVVGGVALDIVAATTSIFFHVTRDMSPNGVGQTYNQFNPAHPPLYWAIMAMLVEALEENARRNDRFAHRTGTDLEMRAAEMAANELAAGGGMGPGETGFNPDIGNAALGSNYYTGEAVRLNQSGNHRGNYFTDSNGVLMFQPPTGPAIRAHLRPNHSATIAEQAAGSTVVINAPTTVAPNVNYTHGGNTESNLSVLNVGGGGSDGSRNLSPFVQ